LTAPIGSLVAVRTSAPHTVLTFDDGPEPGGTDRVLSALAEHGATATFFVLVNRAERQPGLLAEIASAGHEIGLHGVDHRRLTTLPAETVAAGLADGAARLADLLGAPVRYFRPPHGAQTPSVWRAIRRQGLQSVLWGPCAWDWLERPVDQLAAQALHGIGRGTVLLAHDGHATAADGGDGSPAPRIDRGDLTRRVLEGIADRGYIGRSLSGALDHGEPILQPWFMR
jgi:peptidoglycan/xylan/chitin deacetylase (PgdA/CDA1 family)